jgi:hypothetical protein
MNDARVAWLRRSGSVIVLAAVAGCQSALPFLPTAGPNEQMPGPADVRIDGDPQVAAGPARIRIEQEGFAREALIGAGERIQAQFDVSTGVYRIVVVPDRCALMVELARSTETDVVLTLADDASCSLRQLRQHAWGEFEHAFGSQGVVSAEVPIDLGNDVSMDIRSLDDPPNAVPPADSVDESGLLLLEGVLTGSYEVRLLVGGRVVDTQRVEVDDQGRSEPVRFALPSG